MKKTKRKIKGTAERPRISVFRSLRHIYAQIIDDTKGRVLVSAAGNKDIKAASEAGKLLARRALEKGIKKVVFSRGRYLYHGRVKALAEGAREGGLEF